MLLSRCSIMARSGVDKVVNRNRRDCHPCNSHNFPPDTYSVMLVSHPHGWKYIKSVSHILAAWPSWNIVLQTSCFVLSKSMIWCKLKMKITTLKCAIYICESQSTVIYMTFLSNHIRVWVLFVVTAIKIHRLKTRQWVYLQLYATVMTLVYGEE